MSARVEERGAEEGRTAERRISLRVTAEDEERLDWYLSSAFAEGA
ncbi:MAG: hypothetical protein RXO54_06220 [Acidilobus sp.]